MVRISSRDRSLHLALDGTIHLYGVSSDLNRADAPLYLPNIRGASPKYIKGNNYNEGSGGSFTNIHRWSYPKSGLVLWFLHVGGTSETLGHPGTSVLGNFKGAKNSAGSAQIGFIGGLGGNSSNYFHTHIEFRMRINGKLQQVDPRHFFCAGYPAQLLPLPNRG